MLVSLDVYVETNNIDLGLELVELGLGFKIFGEDPGDRSGTSVSNAGDINGDGYDDVIIGAYQGEKDSEYDQGISYVIYGKPSGFDDIDLGVSSSFTGAVGFKVVGEDRGDESGFKVSGLGDINSDGYDDFIIGAYSAEEDELYQGISYVIYGKSVGFEDIELGDSSSFMGTAGFKIIGEDNDDSVGSSVSGAGDINGDGYDDLLIGAFNANESGEYGQGISYVVYGKSVGFEDIDLGDSSSFTGTVGFRIIGGGRGDRSGASVSSVGDVNGDGYDDIIIGAYSNQGKSYVVYGKSVGFEDIDLGDSSSFTGSAGFKIVGEDDGDRSGASVSEAGDINGDRYDDMIVGAYQAEEDSEMDQGISYVIYGKSSGFENIDLGDSSSFTGAVGFKIVGEDGSDNSGVSVSGAGDVNGDGYDDLIIGAFKAEESLEDEGISYVIYGKSEGFEDVDLGDDLTGLGFRIIGKDSQDRSGRSVSGAGDVNGDGYDDLIVGANLAEKGNQEGTINAIQEGILSLLGRTGDSEEGISYVIFGGDFLSNSLVGSGDFSGTIGGENLVGSDGDDVIDTMGGADSVNGGGGG